MEKFVRSRFARLTLACTLIGFGAWAFLPYITYRVAPSAYVNAELMRITAPIRGQLSQDLPKKGEFVDGSTSTKLVDVLMPDRGHLVSLEQDHDVAKAQVDLATSQIAELDGADRDLAERTDRHRAAVLELLGREIQEADAELGACRAEESGKGKVRERAQALADSGIVTKLRLDEAEATFESAVARCNAMAARVQRLKAETAAAQGGVFVQDGTNDVPYSEQQRDRLLLRRQELETEVLGGRSHLAELDAEIAEERSQIDKLSHYELLLPAGHIVWSVLASPGSAVVEGQPVLDLADCTRRFVVVEVPERDFDATMVGGAAAVRLVGADEWLEGRVQQVRGSAARADDRLLAAQVTDPSPRHITVEIALPPDSLSKDSGRFCDIGRLAEVRFDRGGTKVGATIANTWHRIAAAFGLETEQVASRSPALAR